MQSTCDASNKNIKGTYGDLPYNTLNKELLKFDGTLGAIQNCLHFSLIS